MNDPRHPLTAEVQQQIVALVRAGGFPHVVAVAAGVPVRVFEYWLRCGRAKKPQPLYRDLLEQVEQAQAQARLVAETQALRKAPLSWLRYGPGRQTGRLPGWTDAVKPPKAERHAFASSVRRTQELVSTMLEALEPFPEARAALAQALDPIDWLKEDAGMNPDVPADEAQAALAGVPHPEEDIVAPESVPEAPTNAGPVKVAPPPQDDPSPPPQPPVAEQPPTVDEPATNPEPTGNEAPANAEPTGDETATKTQPTGKETATKGQPTGKEMGFTLPNAVPETPPPPRKPAWNPWGPLNDGTWTVVWRLQR